MSKFNNESSPRKGYNPKKKQMREIEFVNYHITEAQKPDLEKFKKQLSETGTDPLEQMLLGGYKVSQNVDYDNECFIVSATGGERTLNPDKCCSSRSDDLYDALCMMLFKCFRNGEQIVWETTPRRNNWG